MASSSTLLSQINEDFLTCQICMDTFKQPKVLSCQHSFCLSCLESCDKTENGSYMVCPICRQKTVLGLQGVKGLKNNFVFSNMIEMLGTWKKSRLMSSPTRSMDSIDNNDVMCNTCPSKDPTMATFQCLDCLDQLCADCAAFHSRTKLTKNHEVVPLQEIESGKYEKAIRARELSRCSTHENVQMQHYCENCDLPVCRDCIVEEHQTHNYISLEEAERMHRENVNDMKSELEVGIKWLDQKLNEIEVLEVKGQESVGQISKEINKKTEEIIEVIKKRETFLLSEIKKMNEENSERISTCKDGLITQLNCIENCIQFSNCVLEDGAAIDIITMNRQMKETVKQLHCKAEEVTTRNKSVMESYADITFQGCDPIPSASILGKITTTVSGSRVNDGETSKAKEIGNDVERKRLDDFKRPLVVQLKPVPRPKPIPRSSGQMESSEKVEEKPFQKPQPVKRRVNQDRRPLSPEPQNRNSVFALTQHISSNLAKSKVRAKSIPNLAFVGGGELSTPKFDIKRQAPVPPGPKKAEGSPGKRVSPKKLKAPPPPPKPPKKALPSTPEKYSQVSQNVSSEPIKANKFVKFGKKGKVITSGEFVGPPKCAIFSGAKKKILVLDSDNRHVMIFTLEGWFKKSFKVALPNQAQLKPVAIAETDNHHLLVLYKNFATMWSWDGNLEHVWGTADLMDATCITTDSRGRILISDQERHMVFVYDSFTRQKVLQFGGFGDRDDLLKSPRYICTNRMDNIIVSDHHNNCVKIFSPEGEFLFKFGQRGVENGEFRYPECVTCLKLEDGDDGIVVADEGNCRVSLFTSNGTFVNHVLTKNDDKGLASPQFLCVSLEGRGEELLVLQTNQIPIRVYRLFQFIDRTS